MQRFDLIVVGGGQAGCAAALAGARGGASVLLVESAGALGGAAVNCLVNPFMPSHTFVEENGERKPLFLCQGIFTEIYHALWDDGIFCDREVTATFHEETLKIILDRKMREAGVKVLLHATLCGVEAEGRCVKSVSVATVGGVLSFVADAFVDATGDAALSAFAGVPFRVGRPEDSLCQPMTLCFRLCNVDTEAASKSMGEIQALWGKLHAEGKLRNPRENVLLFPSRIPGVVHFNTTRVVRHDPTDAFSLSEAEAEAREQMVEMFHFLKDNFPAYRNASLVSSAASIGVRESRMIEARHVLTREELVAGTHFDDGIAAGNYDIDIHSPDGPGSSHWYFPPGVYYTIPYRSLLPKDFDNLVVAGRCIGSTHEAQASIRIMPICMCIGEAAGTAAALAKEGGVAVAEVDVAALRDRLRASGAFVG